jgi:predicted kinase
LTQKYPDYQIVSTDRARSRLFGDEIIQGNWSQVEAEVYREIDAFLQAGTPVIYDATNARRPWRMGLMEHLRQYEGVSWLGWYLKTPLQTCLEWNQQRDRVIPEAVIRRMDSQLQAFPPSAAEGFTVVNILTPNATSAWVKQIVNGVNKLPITLMNRENRNRQMRFHPYSRLLDFERLMYLIRLLIQYPGIGDLHNTDPDLVQTILGEERVFASEVEEICAFLAQIADPIYADPEAVEKDLQWLEKNGLLGVGDLQQELHIETCPNLDYPTHLHSDLQPFSRLIQTIRLIVHHPFAQDSQSKILDSLARRLQKEGFVSSQGENSTNVDNLRKDIEKVLKPYGILPNFSMRRGYFSGTAILSPSDLLKVFRLLESQAKSLEDPESFAVYEKFQERMQWSQLAQSQSYPVRVIHNRNIVNLEKLPPSALVHQTKELEAAIEEGQLLELAHLVGSPRYQAAANNYFFAYPLQLVFHNIGWYLGLEYFTGEQQGLLKFERVDRLLLGNQKSWQRSRSEQLRSLEKLQKLYEASGGIYLGKEALIQQQYLSGNAKQRKKVEVTVELWFNDEMFRFVSEGTKRFPLKQMRMSPSFDSYLNQENKTLFSLSPTKDKRFPHRYRVKLPCWCVEDYDFHRWILGFGGQVKVVSPDKLQQIIKQKGSAIAQIYEEN